MNSRDRKRLAEAQELIQRGLDIIEDLVDAEQEKYDNMTEGLQASEQGQRIEAAAASLDNVKSSLEDAIISIEEIE